MTEELRAKLDSLKTIRDRLNKATDDANNVVARVDRYLEILGIGVPGEGEPFDIEEDPVLDDDGEPIGTVMLNVSRLAYGRTQGTFKIHVVEQLRAVGGSVPLSTREIPWGSCSRDVKLSAVTTLPSLLDNIIEQATELTTKAEAATATVTQMMDALGDRDREDQDVAVDEVVDGTAIKRIVPRRRR